MAQKLILPHDYFVIAAKAWLSYMDAIYQPFSQSIDASFPIQIKNTGDEVFLSTLWEGSKKKSKDLYSAVPRMDVSVAGISMALDQMSNPFNMGHLSTKGKTEFTESRVHYVRRLPVSWIFNAEVKFNNVIEYLKFVDILLTVSFKVHTFHFWYLGQRYDCVFEIPVDYDSDKNISLGLDAEKRHYTLPLNFDLQLQFPAYDIYDVGITDTHEGFGKTETMTKLIHKLHVKSENSPDEGFTTITEIT